MIEWTYNDQEYREESEIKLVPKGEHKVQIENAEETYSKAGAPMIKLAIKVAGYMGKIFHYIVFNYEETSKTNKNLGDIYASFGIKPGDMNLENWLGKTGAAQITHREYNGKTYAGVYHFIPKDMQQNIPEASPLDIETVPIPF